MPEPLNYQIRLEIDEAMAPLARTGEGSPALASLYAVLKRHGGTLVCQYDAFAGYVLEAEAANPDDYTLYAWTKATIEDPAKKAKYLKQFTIYLGEDQVYPADKATAFEAELGPMVGGGVITKMVKYDTNPANNPHPPRPETD